MHFGSVILVVGGERLVGRSIRRQLVRLGFQNLRVPTDAELDLADPHAIDDYFARHQPQYLFHADGITGGIQANRRFPADLAHRALVSTVNILAAAHQHGVRRLLYLASSCSYPRECAQPMKVDHIGTGPLEPTCEAYAAARLAGVALVKAYRAQHAADFVVGIPADAFGCGDDFGPTTSHVLAAIVARLHRARMESLDRVTLWGTGRPVREFIFAEDLADACVFMMRQTDLPPVVNLGSGQARSIRELAELVRDVVGFDGRIEFDASHPDGAPEKTLDSSTLRSLGWMPRTDLRQAIAATYRWYFETSTEPELVHA